MTLMLEDDRAERVREAIGALLPTFGHVAPVRRVEVGWANENWTADTNHGRVMVKIGLPDSSAAKWRAAGVALGLARAADVPAPELLAFEDASELLDGRVLRIFSYVEGESPRTIVDDPVSRARFLGQLGGAVARLHRVAQPRFSSRIGDGHGFERWSDYLADRWRSVVARAEGAGLDRDLVASADAALFPAVARFDDVAHPVVCHRDLYLDNLLCDGDGNLVALLDFDMAEAWEPAADFHKLRWWVFGSDAAAEREFLSGYRAGVPLPDDFDARVRLVEIIELVNGIADWVTRGDGGTGVCGDAEARLRTLLRA